MPQGRLQTGVIHRAAKFARVFPPRKPGLSGGVDGNRLGEYIGEIRGQVNRVRIGMARLLIEDNIEPLRKSNEIVLLQLQRKKWHYRLIGLGGGSDFLRVRFFFRYGHFPCRTRRCAKRHRTGQQKCQQKAEDAQQLSGGLACFHWGGKGNQTFSDAPTMLRYFRFSIILKMLFCIIPSY